MCCGVSRGKGKVALVIHNDVRGITMDQYEEKLKRWLKENGVQGEHLSFQQSCHKKRWFHSLDLCRQIHQDALLLLLQPPELVLLQVVKVVLFRV